MVRKPRNRPHVPHVPIHSASGPDDIRDEALAPGIHTVLVPDRVL